MVLFIKNVRYLNKKFKKIKEENRKLVKDLANLRSEGRSDNFQRPTLLDLKMDKNDF